MKLLFDENLSRKLVRKLADLYPGSSHAILERLDRSSDTQLREFAAKKGFVVVTRDSDFRDLDAVFGLPPKTIWIHRENAATADFEKVLRMFHEQIEAFAVDQERSLLIIT